MLALFFPPVIAVIIGVVVLVVGLAVHSTLIAGIGILGVAVGAARYVRRRSGNGIQR